MIQNVTFSNIVKSILMTIFAMMFSIFVLNLNPLTVRASATLRLDEQYIYPNNSQMHEFQYFNPNSNITGTGSLTPDSVSTSVDTTGTSIGSSTTNIQNISLTSTVWNTTSKLAFNFSNLFTYNRHTTLSGPSNSISGLIFLNDFFPTGTEYSINIFSPVLPDKSITWNSPIQGSDSISTENFYFASDLLITPVLQANSVTITNAQIYYIGITGSPYEYISIRFDISVNPQYSGGNLELRFVSKNLQYSILDTSHTAYGLNEVLPPYIHIDSVNLNAQYQSVKTSNQLFKDKIEDYILQSSSNSNSILDKVTSIDDSIIQSNQTSSDLNQSVDDNKVIIDQYNQVTDVSQQYQKINDSNLLTPDTSFLTQIIPTITLFSSTTEGLMSSFGDFSAVFILFISLVVVATILKVSAHVDTGIYSRDSSGNND